MMVPFQPILRINKTVIFERMRVSNTSNMYHKVSEIFDECLANIENLIHYQAVYLIEDNLHKINYESLRDSEKVIYCFVTIGEDICTEINRIFDAKDYLKGYILNEIANEIVMDATDQLYFHIKNLVKKDDFNLSKRYSPGECSFDMSYQKTIFERLEKHFDIQASLTDAYMIYPEKSTLFVYGADKSFSDSAVDYDCSTCQSINCPYKRT
ncbi:MAG: hypothetical protein JXQ26_10150 [Tissierellales bacterium]|nr:hypothetical protein [Tissierellales bacterium]MBN2828345.1 hypothetical protein [Tissierellales bacterium]